VRYRDIPAGRDIDIDVVPRMTFYWTW
jgi:hypothetical protein